jgi:heme/copper-type cytochrome/quinol oxidase subunit 4
MLLIAQKFSQGQVYFAIAFLAIFVVAMFFTYKKDLKQTRGTYKGVYRMFIYIGLVLGFYWILLKLIG